MNKPHSLTRTLRRGWSCHTSKDTDNCSI